MSREKIHKTRAIRVLNQNRVNFSPHSYKYEEKGGTQTASRELGVEEHLVIKTLVMEDQEKNPFLVLMHGDKEVSTKALARTLGVKAVKACTPEAAHKHTGYMVGGISPFGTRKPLKVLVESSILELPRIFINAGKRGLLAEMSPADLNKVLRPVPVNVAISRK